MAVEAVGQLEDQRHGVDAQLLEPRGQRLVCGGGGAQQRVRRDVPARERNAVLVAAHLAAHLVRGEIHGGGGGFVPKKLAGSEFEERERIDKKDRDPNKLEEILGADKAAKIDESQLDPKELGWLLAEKKATEDRTATYQTTTRMGIRRKEGRK